MILLLSEGQMSDYKGAALMLDALPRAKAMLADKGYDAGWFRDALAKRGIRCLYPLKNQPQESTDACLSDADFSLWLMDSQFRYKSRFAFSSLGERFVISPLLPNYNRADIAFDRGEGPYLFDAKGERYLDFGSGVAVSALGHAHPHLVAALQEQAGKLWHTSNLYRIPGQERLAQRLVDASFADRAFFANSGAEGVECAIKMARRFHYVSGAPERYRLITFEGAFHGRTLATIAAGGSPKYLEGFGPKVDGFDQVPYGDFDAVVRATGPETAGILVEPIQGEVGIHVPPAGFLKRLREFCDARGLLLVLDEVQTGIARHRPALRP